MRSAGCSLVKRPVLGELGLLPLAEPLEPVLPDVPGLLVDEQLEEPVDDEPGWLELPELEPVEPEVPGLVVPLLLELPELPLLPGLLLPPVEGSLGWLGAWANVT